MNKKGYCNLCVVCVKTKDISSEPIYPKKLTKEDRKLYYKNRCLQTKNKIKTDRRCVDNIKVIKEENNGQNNN